MPYNQLDQKAKNEFYERGVIHLPNVIPSLLVNALKESALALSNQVLMFQSDTLKNDSNVSLEGLTPYVNRIMHYHHYAEAAQLAMMGNPFIDHIATYLCGKSALPTADMLIFKHREVHAKIPWHQDFIDIPKTYSAITIGIYLDDSPIGDGNVQFIAGSHHKKYDVCAIEHQGKQVEQLTEFDIKAGDIVIHDPMIVHRSGPLIDQKMRRTLYYEFRSKRHIEAQENWPNEFLNARQHLYSLAYDIFKKNADNSYSIALDECDKQSISECYQIRLPKILANYCQCKAF